jgi:hypothetical protein
MGISTYHLLRKQHVDFLRDRSGSRPFRSYLFFYRDHRGTHARGGSGAHAAHETGGVTFAAFPLVYAVMFSSLYSALMLILFALIIRGVSFEFRGKIDSSGWKKLWTDVFLSAVLFPRFSSLSRSPYWPCWGVKIYLGSKSCWKALFSSAVAIIGATFL